MPTKQVAAGGKFVQALWISVFLELLAHITGLEGGIGRRGKYPSKSESVMAVWGEELSRFVLLGLGYQPATLTQT